jgi:hypothetical protein
MHTKQVLRTVMHNTRLPFIPSSVLGLFMFIYVACLAILAMLKAECTRRHQSGHAMELSSCCSTDWLTKGCPATYLPTTAYTFWSHIQSPEVWALQSTLFLRRHAVSPICIDRTRCTTKARQTALSRRTTVGSEWQHAASMASSRSSQQALHNRQHIAKHSRTQL